MAKKPDIQLIDRIVKEEGLTPGQRDLLHDEIHGQGYTQEQIRERQEISRNTIPINRKS